MFSCLPFALLALGFFGLTYLPVYVMMVRQNQPITQGSSLRPCAAFRIATLSHLDLLIPSGIPSSHTSTHSFQGIPAFFARSSATCQN
jgi:hypothetical protein